jgi:hypothetical protein
MNFKPDNLFLGTSILASALSSLIVLFVGGAGMSLSIAEDFTNLGGTRVTPFGILILLCLTLLVAGLFYFYPLVRNRETTFTLYHFLPPVFLMPGLIVGIILLRLALKDGLTL